MSKLYTYSYPYLSLWQTAAAGVKRRHASPQKLAIQAGQTPAAPPPEVDLEAPVHFIGVPLAAGQPDTVQAMFAPKQGATLDLAAAADAVLHTAEDCAKAAAEFLWAEITGNKDRSDTLAGELKESECDPTWAECLIDYLAFKAAVGTPAYRKNKNPVFALDSNTRIAIVGDWGTGEDVAADLLRQIKTFNPAVLLHLGDVYYSGTQFEQQTNFVNVCQSVLGNTVRLFSMCGNHDMYSGGEGYYWLVDKIGQQASYFCLQNADWQFLAMDTGHNDNDPFTVNTNMTSLYKDADWAEEDWLLDKINLAGTRKQVLFSHHQLFSAFGSVGSADGGKSYAYNKNLHATFQAVLDKISCWFWGHEHTLAIYKSYMGLQRGRCVGASAVPVFKDQQSYTAAKGLQTYGSIPLPDWNTQGVLGNNGTDYNHCFAVLTLTGASATVDYYQVPVLKPFQKLPISESF